MDAMPRRRLKYQLASTRADSMQNMGRMDDGSEYSAYRDRQSGCTSNVLSSLLKWRLGRPICALIRRTFCYRRNPCRITFSIGGRLSPAWSTSTPPRPMPNPYLGEDETAEGSPSRILTHVKANIRPDC